MTADVSVIIPTRNRLRLLLRAIDSVLHQQDVRVEIIVVDDGGSDGSADFARSLDLANVKVLRHEQRCGVSRARNTGLGVAESQWVAFLDDDDVWAPTKLSKQLTSLEAHEHAMWSCVGAATVNAQLEVMSLQKPPPSGDCSSVLLRNSAIPGGGSGVVASRDLVNQIGGFDERVSILADWDLYLRLSLCSPVAAIDEPLVAYYFHRDSMLHDPVGILAELDYMADKLKIDHRSTSLDLDYRAWYLFIIRIALRLRDLVTAGRIGRKAIRQLGFWDVLRGGVSLAAQKLVRRLRCSNRTPVRPAELSWLGRYDARDPSQWSLSLADREAR